MPARDLPVGTVSFVFTDIEGSTRLLQDLGVLGAGFAGATMEGESLSIEQAVALAHEEMR